jgi:hypothetical protein
LKTDVLWLESGTFKVTCMLQVCLYTCGDLIASVPFFEDAEEGFTTSVVTLLHPVVSLYPRAALAGSRAV